MHAQDSYDIKVLLKDHAAWFNWSLLFIKPCTLFWLHAMLGRLSGSIAEAYCVIGIGFQQCQDASSRRNARTHVSFKTDDDCFKRIPTSWVMTIAYIYIYIDIPSGKHTRSY